MAKAKKTSKKSTKTAKKAAGASPIRIRFSPLGRAVAKKAKELERASKRKKLEAGRAKKLKRIAANLKTIEARIRVLCSKGDDIPPTFQTIF